MNTLQLIINIIGVFLIAYVIYFVAVSLFALKKTPKYEETEKKGKFAMIVAARNEEAVIGHLVESLQNLDYPKELYDIIVLPNNCTDNTKGVAEEAGARIYEPKRIIKSKGDVLQEFFNHIELHSGEEEWRFDGYCIFDADNLVDKDFLTEMNKAYQGGAKVAQGYRDSKNPYDTVISSSYTIYYLSYNRFYNNARANIGLSALISGCGFMISQQMIDEMGGWNTKSMTEDIEITTKTVLMGEKVKYVPKAKIYDEQPLTFEVSWKQRSRWSTGLIQDSELYSWPLWKQFIKTKNWSAMDIVLFFGSIPVQLLYAILCVLVIIYDFMILKEGSMSLNIFLLRSTTIVSLSYFGCIIMTVMAIYMEKKSIRKMWKGILYYWVFIFSWIPINFICLFKKETTWHQIDHTRGINMDEMLQDEK